MKPLTAAQWEVDVLRVIGEALRQSLRVSPVDERQIVKSFSTVPGVTSEMVERVITSFINAGWVERRGKKLHGVEGII